MKLNKILVHILDNWFKYFSFLFLLLMVFVFRKPILILALVLIGGLSQIYKRLIPFSIGIELITFFTIVICFGINPFVGAICAILMIFLAHFFSGKVCMFMFVKMAIYIGICLFATILFNLGIVSAGRILVVMLNLAYILVNGIFLNMRVAVDIPGNIINVFFNFYLFSSFGELMVSLL